MVCYHLESFIVLLLLRLTAFGVSYLICFFIPLTEHFFSLCLWIAHAITPPRKKKKKFNILVSNSFRGKRVLDSNYETNKIDLVGSLDKRFCS